MSYIFNALLMNPDDPQFQIASQIMDDLYDNMNQWLSLSEMQELDDIAAQYGENSAEYKAKLKQLILANLDQAQEWVEEHSHVEFVPEVNETPEVSLPSDSVDSTQDVSDDSQSEENTVVNYDKNSVIYRTGQYGDYSSGRCLTSSSYGNKDDILVEGKTNFTNDARNRLTEIGNSLKQELQSKMGDAYDDSVISQYIEKAIQNTITAFINNYEGKVTGYGDANYEKPRDSNGIFFASKKKNDGRICYSLKNLIDYFFNEFDQLYKNNGKSAAEVEAEKQAEEEKQNQLRNSYQNLYNMDMHSTASEAGVPDTVTAVPTGSNQFAQIQEKAETDIIEPLKNRIKEKMKGQSIPDADLEAILESAATQALSNPNNWASTSNSYSYTIDSNKLIDLFTDAVKKAINKKGFEF